jgi:trans-2,3-dihydro-3-hydroxyanthranilate isomerase
MVPTHRYRIVDVFSDRPLAGNALCVVLDPAPEPVMQAIAKEVNLSETTFPIVTGDAEYEVRIFAPSSELPFAGHPSLGTAWALGPGTWTQTSAGAVVEIEADAGGASMSQPDPTLTEVESADAVAALGLSGAEGAWLAEVGGMTHVLVATTSPLERLQPDMAAVARTAAALGAPSLVPVRRIDDQRLHVRAFVPGAGIVEDPGTGSAAGPIGVLCRGRWAMADDVVIQQGDEMGRPCRIDVHVGADGVRVGGRVALCAEGGFTLGPQ